MSPVLLAPDATVPVLDRSRLFDEFGDDPETLAELRRIFLENVPFLVRRIRKSLASGNTVNVADVAHSLKGAASTYGALRIMHVCAQLETLARKDQLADAEGAAELLQSELQEFERALNQHHRMPAAR